VDWVSVTRLARVELMRRRARRAHLLARLGRHGGARQERDDSCRVVGDRPADGESGRAEQERDELASLAPSSSSPRPLLQMDTLARRAVRWMLSQPRHHPVRPPLPLVTTRPCARPTPCALARLSSTAPPAAPPLEQDKLRPTTSTSTDRPRPKGKAKTQPKPRTRKELPELKEEDLDESFVRGASLPRTPSNSAPLPLRAALYVKY